MREVRALLERTVRGRVSAVERDNRIINSRAFVSFCLAQFGTHSHHETVDIGPVSLRMGMRNAGHSAVMVEIVLSQLWFVRK